MHDAHRELRRQAAMIFADTYDPESDAELRRERRQLHAHRLTLAQQEADPDRRTGYTLEELERGHAQLAAANPPDTIAEILGHPSDVRDDERPVAVPTVGDWGAAKRRSDHARYLATCPPERR